MVLSALLVIELVIENLHLKANRKQLISSQEEIKDLQERLYEKAQEELAKGGFTELEVDDRD